MSLPSKNTKIQTSRMSPSASTTERGENARTAGAPPSASTTDGGPNARTAGAPLSVSTTDRGESARTAGAPPSASTTSGAAGGTGGADEGTDAGKRKTREADKELLALLRETGMEKEVVRLAGHRVYCVLNFVSVRTIKGSSSYRTWRVCRRKIWQSWGCVFASFSITSRPRIRVLGVCDFV
jgi:hypothetical protein